MADLSITATQVQPVTGHSRQVDGIAGEAIIPGQGVASDSSSGSKLIKLFDADSTNTYLNTVVGLAANEALASGQPIKYESGDQINIGTSAAPVVGKVYLGSRTPGGITPAGDSTNTGYVNVIGVGMASGKLNLILSASGVTGQI